jgi:hypothetical protein
VIEEVREGEELRLSDPEIMAWLGLDAAEEELG